MKTLLDILEDKQEKKANNEFKKIISNNKLKYRLMPIFKKDKRMKIGWRLYYYGIFPTRGRNAKKVLKKIK